MGLNIFGDFSFVGGSNETANRFQDAQRLINWYVEVSPSKASKMVTALNGCPGLVPLAAGAGGGVPGYTADNYVLTADTDSFTLAAWNLPSTILNLPVRCCWTLPGRQQALTVIGNTCYLVTKGGTGSNGLPSLALAPVGTLLTSSGPVRIRDNGIQGGVAVIVDGPYGYLYQLSGQSLSVKATGVPTPGSPVVTSQTLNALVVGSSVSDTDGLVAVGTTLLSVDVYGGTFTLSEPLAGSGSGPYATTSTSGTGIQTPLLSASVSGGVMTVTFAAQSSAPPVGSTVSITGAPPLTYDGKYVVLTSGTTFVSFQSTVEKGGLGGYSPEISLQGVATVNFPTQSAAPPVGANVTISGVTPAAYNGTYPILSSTTSSVSFTSFASGAQTAPGSVDWPSTVPATDTFTFTSPAWAQIQDPAFLGADTVAYIDGWWIFNRPGTAQFYTNSAPYSSAFNGSYYAYKDAFSDSLVAVIENKEELWLIGEETTEIWYDSGGAYFPFQRLVGTLLQMGCAAAQSVCQLSQGGDDSLVWLGRNVQGENVIVRTSGFAWEVVSTPAVSAEIATYSVTSDAIGYVYQEDAHEFYVLTFPTADRTWVYDSTLPPDLAWHERRSYDPYGQQWHRHRSNCFMQFAGMHIVGDFENGVLYQLTRSAYSDAGWPLRAVRRSPYVWSAQDRERVFMQSLQLDFRLGQGTAGGIGANPQANLRISRDYGATYGSTIQAPMGAQGQTLNRCMYRRLGFSRGAVLELEVMDPVNRDLVGATLKAMSP